MSQNPKMNVVKILRRPEKLRRALAVLLQRYLNCYESCGNATSRYDGLRVSGTAGRHDDKLVTLADLNNKIQKQYQTLAAAECDANNLLQKIMSMSVRYGHRDALLLCYRYRDNLSWPDVRKKLSRKGYTASEKTLRNWHKAALWRTNTLNLKQKGDTDCGTDSQ